jgi:magnesium chelatase accessory protein
LHLLAADLDKALPPSQSQRATRLVPQASFATLPALGHLAHEEDPQLVFERIEPLLAKQPPG